MASPKSSSPQSAVSFFLFQFPASSLSLNVVQLLPTSSSSSSCHLYPSLYLSFNNLFSKALATQDVTIHLAFLLFIVCRIFLCSLTLRNTSLFFTRSVKMIFSILLQQHISEFPRYFRYPLRSVQVLAPHKAMLQI